MSEKHAFDDDFETEINTPKAHSSSLTWWTAALGVGLLVVGSLVYLQSAEMDSLRQAVNQFGAVQAKESAEVRAIVAKSDYELQSVLREFRSELAGVQQLSTAGVKQAQVAATRRADVLANQIESRQKERAEKFTQELAKVRESHDDAANKINSISTEVGAVKTEVETAKSSIQQSIADLQRVRGDLGLISGLIATNSKEIQILRDLGDRDIFEFSLARSSGLQQVGDIRLMLKKADTGRNRYTVEVLSDDKRVEKKDKSLNEPVQFYVSSRAAKQPYELVVNEVKKNMIVGYLARPKLVMARAR